MHSQTSDAEPGERTAIHQAAMDYMQGWYEGNQARMERCLHPDLIKRSKKRDPQTGQESFNHLTKANMVEATPQGSGTQVAREKLYYDVAILDVYDDIATVRAESYDWIDYLHLTKHEDHWLIVNVLYTANRFTKPNSAHQT